MMKAVDMLAEHRERYPELSDAQFHPLAHQDVLREAQIIDVWIRAMNGTGTATATLTICPSIQITWRGRQWWTTFCSR